MAIVRLDILDGIQKVLQWVFNEIFVPVLKDVFNIVFYMIMDMLQEVLAGFFLKIWVALLKVVNFIEAIFDIFSGLTQVQVNNVSSNQGILQYLFGLDVVQRAMLLITAVSFVLAMLTTGIAVIQSISDSVADNKKPISTVLREALRTALTFMLIPFACLFAVEMVQQVLIQINSALVIGNSNKSLGDTIFYTLAEPTHKKKGYEIFASGNRFENIAKVQKYFDYKKIDYIIAIIVTLFLMMVLVTTIVQFIQRLFMILILYIISPLFAAYMPLDGGKSFKQWRDSFVAFMISAFSPMIAMKLYMKTLQIFLNGKMVFPVQAPGGDALMKLLLVMGGSYAVYSSRNLLVKLYNPSLGEQLDANAFVANYVLGRIGMGVRGLMRNPSQGKDKKPGSNDKKKDA